MPIDTNMLMSLAWIVGIFALFYFMIIRPQKTAEKKATAMRNSLKVGDKVVTIGGICGKIVTMKEDDGTMTIISGTDGTKICLQKWSVQRVEAESAE